MRIVVTLAIVALSTLVGAEEPARANLRFGFETSPAQREVSPLSLTAHQIVRDSAQIFAGTVLSVEHSSLPSGNARGFTRVRFRVQNAIRGVRAGQVLEVREWSGLWNAGERYRVGENVLLFLYPASKLGLTSPVGGAAGRFRVDKTWRVQIGNASPLPRVIASRKHVVPVREFAAAIRREAKE